MLDKLVGQLYFHIFGVSSLLVVRAHAKINLLLDVLYKRRDGFHELKSIMQSLELHDRIELKSARDISLIVNTNAVPEGPENLVWRAAELLREYASVNQGVSITLHKNIPAAAGLGGGSADAAAVLKGLNKLWDLNIKTQELAAVGAKIGSDVPFCIYGGTALVCGRGEKVTSLPLLPQLDVVLVKPAAGLSTAQVYNHYDLCPAVDKPSLDAGGMIEAIKLHDIDRIIKLMGNALEKPAISLFPEIADIKKALAQNGAMGVLMSGSGPTVFGIAESRRHAEIIAGNLSFQGAEVFITKTIKNNNVFNCL